MVKYKNVWKPHLNLRDMQRVVESGVELSKIPWMDKMLKSSKHFCEVTPNIETRTEQSLYDRFLLE